MEIFGNRNFFCIIYTQVWCIIDTISVDKISTFCKTSKLLFYINSYRRMMILLALHVNYVMYCFNIKVSTLLILGIIFPSTHTFWKTYIAMTSCMHDFILFSFLDAFKEKHSYKKAQRPSHSLVCYICKAVRPNPCYLHTCCNPHIEVYTIG